MRDYCRGLNHCDIIARSGSNLIQTLQGGSVLRVYGLGFWFRVVGRGGQHMTAQAGRVHG